MPGRGWGRRGTRRGSPAAARPWRESPARTWSWSTGSAASSREPLAQRSRGRDVEPPLADERVLEAWPAALEPVRPAPERTTHGVERHGRGAPGVELQAHEPTGTGGEGRRPQ